MIQLAVRWHFFTKQHFCVLKSREKHKFNLLLTVRLDFISVQYCIRDHSGTFLFTVYVILILS